MARHPRDAPPLDPDRNRSAPKPIFYAYAYPTPDGFATATVEPDAAFWLDDLGEFALPYAAAAADDDPDATLLRFWQSTHAAAADLSQWDRRTLECNDPHGPDWWWTRPHASRGCTRARCSRSTTSPRGRCPCACADPPTTWRRCSAICMARGSSPVTSTPTTRSAGSWRRGSTPS
ncbi:MAG: DUF5996 family protein [Acidimicrobiales bacterium]